LASARVGQLRSLGPLALHGSGRRVSGGARAREGGPRLILGETAPRVLLVIII